APSLYLNPDPLVRQKGLPELDIPCGRLKSCADGWVPLAMTVRNAPPALPDLVGSPVIVRALLSSLAEVVSLRFWPTLGFFTMNALPRTCWSLACAQLPSRPSPASTADSARVRLMGPPLRVDGNTPPAEGVSSAEVTCQESFDSATRNRVTSR